MKRILSLILAFTLAIQLCVCAEYTSSDWAAEEVEKAEQSGIIPDILINEDLREDITRKEFAHVCLECYEALGGERKDNISETPFTDVDDETITEAYSIGLISGVGNDLFAPDDRLTREQAAVMLVRVFKSTQMKGWSLSEDEKFVLEYDELLVGVKAFKDTSEISDWARTSVDYLLSKDIAAGNEENMFLPLGSITREESLLLSLRLVNTVKEGISGNFEDSPDDTREKFTIVFLGGSLTYGGTIWRNMVKDYFQEKYPDKNVAAINSGRGGTGSDYGAARFCEHVAKYNPDLVFLDCTINDRGAKEETHKTYIESIIRQTASLESNPALVVLHFPYPDEKTSDAYKQWQEGMNWKNEVCDHYGVRHIDVYDYIYREYLSQKKDNQTFTQFFEDVYFVRAGDVFNVHPISAGYEMYGKAILEDFEKNPFDPETEKIKDTGVFYTKNRADIISTYRWIPVNSPRMHYSKDAWTVTSSEYFPEGVRQTYQATVPALIGFDSNAKEFCFSYIASANGSDAKVTVDDTEVFGTLSCYSNYEGVNYKTGWIQLPNDGKMHKVVITVDRPSGDKYLFRFGAVIERFAK